MYSQNLNALIIVDQLLSGFTHMIKFTLINLILITIISAQEPIEGLWLTPKDNTIIETYQKDDKWFGKIVSSDNPKAIEGLDILRNFTQSGKHFNGKIFAIKRRKTIDATIKPNKNCIFRFLLAP